MKGIISSTAWHGIEWNGTGWVQPVGCPGRPSTAAVAPPPPLLRPALLCSARPASPFLCSLIYLSVCFLPACLPTRPPVFLQSQLPQLLPSAALAVGEDGGYGGVFIGDVRLSGRQAFASAAEGGSWAVRWGGCVHHYGGDATLRGYSSHLMRFRRGGGKGLQPPQLCVRRWAKGCSSRAGG